MRREDIVGLVLFGSLWGCIEAVVGGLLYAFKVPFASVPLCILAFLVLSLCRSRYPKPGTSTFVGFVAMLYKLVELVNPPCYLCHLLAIFLIGLSYDVVFSFKLNRSLQAFLATYLGHLLFALTITYVVRYRYWVEEGVVRIFRYVGLSGSLAALVNMAVVPLWFRLSERGGALKLPLKPAWAGIVGIALLWAVAVLIRLQSAG